MMENPCKCIIVDLIIQIKDGLADVDGANTIESSFGRMYRYEHKRMGRRPSVKVCPWDH
ncbi:hypothetical protein CHS0354_001464 [Potamilus streckersoni]|uniref:Uncharacterized protein n=1 Tax=Potamilus streckersoni TaxID=2493646 RepID=A0AAE0T8V2_9BIVA|nr:hypothetical protein CHS0354_001464 [Potamilus streckersoni]